MPRKKYQTKKRYQYDRRRIYKPKRRKSFLRGPFFWFFILFLLILTGIGYLVIFSNFFEVKSIEISGHEKISPEEIRRTLEENIESAGKLLVLKPENAIADIFLGKVVINKEQFESLIKITDAISGNLQIPTKELLIQNESQNITEDIGKIKVKTQEVWDIYFDLKNNVDWQIIKLSSVLEKEIPQEKRGDLEYVDLRIGNFAPYKYRDRE